MNSHIAPAQWVANMHQVLLHHLGSPHSSLLGSRGPVAVAAVGSAHAEESLWPWLAAAPWYVG